MDAGRPAGMWGRMAPRALIAWVIALFFSCAFAQEKDAAIAHLRKHFGPGTPCNGHIDELDGITIDCFSTRGEMGGWWCNVRKSNTEPLLRLNLEAKDRKTLEKVMGIVTPGLGKRVDH